LALRKRLSRSKEASLFALLFMPSAQAPPVRKGGRGISPFDQVIGSPLMDLEEVAGGRGGL
jgi:hypothetical protein